MKAADILARKDLAAAPVVTKVVTPVPEKLVTAAAPTPVVAPTSSQDWKPDPRVCSYLSRAPNTKIVLGNNEEFTFNGNYYTTDDSAEIYELDNLCKRTPNVFSKVI